MSKNKLRLIDNLISKGFGRRRIAEELEITEWAARKLIAELTEALQDNSDRTITKGSPSSKISHPYHKLVNTSGKPSIKVTPSRMSHGVESIDSDRVVKIQKRPTSYSVAVLGDCHFPYQNDTALTIAKAYLSDNIPDCIIFIGDICDCYSVSQYNKNTERKLTFQDEIDYCKEKLQEWVEEFPSVKFYFITGNHETRHKRLMQKYANQLSTLRSMKIEELLGLSDMGIQYISDDEDLEIGSLTFVHGEFARKYAGSSIRATFEKIGASAIQGHVHRGSLAFKRTKQGIHTLIENMCMCDLNVEYDRFPDWVNGFTVIHYDGEDFHADLLPIPGNKLITNGLVYTV